MDAIAEWTAAQQRVSDLTRHLNAAQAETIVPSCPDWTVRDLLSHMVGLGADVIAGDEPEDHNPEWTQRQVTARHGRPITDLLTEWDGLADDLRAWMREHDARPLGDVVIHEQDLRGALGVPGGHGTDGLRMLRDRMADGFASRLAGLPTITLRSGTWTWHSDDGGETGAVVVEADEFDLTRALMSRRSPAQLRSWTIVGDIGPFLDAFAALGPLPDTDLTES